MKLFLRGHYYQGNAPITVIYKTRLKIFCAWTTSFEYLPTNSLQIKLIIKGIIPAMKVDGSINKII